MIAMQALLQSGSQAENVAELLKLICKAFWSATYMGIPDMLLQQEQFVGWMTCIHTFMDMPVPKVDLLISTFREWLWLRQIRC